MFQDTPFKLSLYDSEYYAKSLEIHKNILDNVSCNNLQSVKLWSHLNGHILTCIKQMYPNLKNYVEIGTHYGISFCGILNSGYYKDHNFISIDPDQNMNSYDKTNKTGHDILKENIKMFNKENNYTILKGYSNDENIINKLKTIIDEIDLLYIDGDHSYEGVTVDFENYFPLVRKNGFIIFDDYLPYTRDSHKAINDIVEKYKNQIEIIGILEDKIGANKIKPSQYIKEKKIPFVGADKRKIYNMSFIIKKM